VTTGASPKISTGLNCHRAENADQHDQLDSNWLRFDARLGPVSVGLLTNCPRVFADYATVNRELQSQGKSLGFRTTVLVEKRRSWRSGIAHYHISGEVEERFTVRKRARVVPHIDGMINLSVARHLPDYVQLHAAVLQRGDVGLVIPGGPGFGKTTLAAALIKRGWDYASDEFALIDPQTIKLAAFPKSLSIKPGSVKLLEDEGIDIAALPRFHRIDKGAIRCLPATHIRGAALVDCVTPQLMVFPQLDDKAEPTMRELSRGMAAMNCLRRCFNFSRWGPIAMETVAQMCERCACYEITSGDLAQTCQLIDEAAGKVVHDLSEGVNRSLKVPQVDDSSHSKDFRIPA